MARVVKFKKLGNFDGARLHGVVDCGVRVLDLIEGRFVQLETYGSRSREMTGQVSQTIQIDVKAARELVEILVSAFPSIAVGK